MTSDPIERIRHDISHAHNRRHKDTHAALYQPLKSDLEVGVDFLLAAARSRVHRVIDNHADAVRLQLGWIVEQAYSDLGLRYVRR